MLEDRLEVLKTLNDNFNINQRELAKRTNMSLGKINSVLKEFTEDGFIDRIENNRGILYKVTDKGMKFLEENIVSAKIPMFSTSSLSFNLPLWFYHLQLLLKYHAQLSFHHFNISDDLSCVFEFTNFPLV